MSDDVLVALASAGKKKKRRKKKRCRMVKRTKVVNGKRKVVKVRKCKPRKKPAKKPAPTYQAPPPVPAPPVPEPPAPPRLKTIQSPIAVYQGAFGVRQAERLAWRAGFGPRPGQAAELAAMDLDLIVASALPHALLVRAANPNVPMVIGTGAGLVCNGFGRTMERPGGNATGMDELPAGLTARRLELLTLAAPRLRRVGLLSTTPARCGHDIQLADALAGAERLGVAVQAYRAATVAEVGQALAAMVRDGQQGFVNFQGGLSLGERQRIVDYAAANRLPAIYQSVLFAEAGGLMTWAPDQNEQLRMAARYADRILRGAAPGDLPILHPDRYFLTLNRQAAQRIGLAFPQPLLDQADRVIG
jgi:putative ABC transport system substrate-binding protein